MSLEKLVPQDQMVPVAPQVVTEKLALKDQEDQLEPQV